MSFFAWVMIVLFGPIALQYGRLRLTTGVVTDFIGYGEHAQRESVLAVADKFARSVEDLRAFLRKSTPRKKVHS